MVLDPTTLLTTLAAIIGLGYLGSYLFEATRIPDIVLLIAFGFLLGPATGLLDPPPFRTIAPVMGTFALIVILFEGGLSLSFEDLLHGLGRATLLSVVGWSLTTILIGAGLAVLLGWDLALGLLLGTILAGTSSVIVVPILSRLDVGDRTRVTLNVESAVTDVLCIVGALTVLNIITAGQVDLQTASGALVARFSTAIVVGAVAGFAWGRVWSWVEKGAYAYMATLAALLIVHVTVEAIGGSGPIAVLAVGVMLGNRLILFGRETSRAWEPGGEMRRFQSEVSFFVRSFFFVLLGIVIQPRELLDPVFLATVGIVLAGILVARWLAVQLVATGDDELSGDRDLLFAMMPRGLAAAVLALLPAQRGIAGTTEFIDYAFAAIIITNVIVAVALPLLDRPHAPAEEVERVGAG